MSFWDDIKAAFFRRKIQRISDAIAKIGRQRMKLKNEALHLTNKRERLLGQKPTLLTPKE